MFLKNKLLMKKEMNTVTTNNDALHSGDVPRDRIKIDDAGVNSIYHNRPRPAEEGGVVSPEFV